MKKALIITVVLVSITAIFTGCTQPAVQPSTPPAQEQGKETGAPAAKIAAEAEDAQGKLIGRIDNNSIEIEITPSDTLAFRVTDVLEQLKDIKDGEMVKFSYTSNDQGQMIITKIEKLK